MGIYSTSPKMHAEESRGAATTPRREREGIATIAHRKVGHDSR
jgi:hypothetical protein